MMTLAWNDLDLFYCKVKFGNLGFGEKVKTVDFSETIAASDLKVCTCRELIEFMKEGQGHFFYHIISRFRMFCDLLGQDIR